VVARTYVLWAVAETIDRAVEALSTRNNCLVTGKKRKKLSQLQALAPCVSFRGTAGSARDENAMPCLAPFRGRRRSPWCVCGSPRRHAGGDLAFPRHPPFHMAVGLDARWPRSRTMCPVRCRPSFDRSPTLAARATVIDGVAVAYGRTPSRARSRAFPCVACVPVAVAARYGRVSYWPFFRCTAKAPVRRLNSSRPVATSLSPRSRATATGRSVVLTAGDDDDELGCRSIRSDPFPARPTRRWTTPGTTTLRGGGACMAGKTARRRTSRGEVM
jgi:hypothetical protein